MNQSGFSTFFVIYSTTLHIRTQTKPEYFIVTVLRLRFRYYDSRLTILIVKIVESASKSLAEGHLRLRS